MLRGLRRLFRPHNRTHVRASVVQLASASIVLVSVEILGRALAQTDAHDLVGLPFLTLGLFAAYRGLRPHATPASRVLGGFVRRVRNMLGRLDYPDGLDLRERPPIRRSIPFDVSLIVVGLPALGVLVGWLAALAGEDPRIVGRVSYVVHVLGLATSWGLLLGVAALSAFLGGAVVHDFFLNRFVGTGKRPRRSEMACYVSAGACIALGAFFLPRWTAVALLAAVVALAFMLLWNPWMPRLTMLWRHPRTRRIGSVDWRWTQSRDTVLLGFLIFDTLAFVFGPTMIGLAPGIEALPVTRVLWTFAAWTPAVAAAFAMVFVVRGVRECIGNDPARSSPTVVHVDGVGENRAALERIARERGWRLRFAPQPADALDVRIRVVPAPMPPIASPPAWPLPVSARALELTELQDMLIRCDVEQRRDAFFAGVELLFGHASRRAFTKGTGFWLAPHLWFIGGMSRDTDEDPEQGGGVIHQLVGPMYTKVFARAVRHHVHQMMGALEIDLMYVEDGVRFEGVRRVLMQLFAHWDTHAPAARLEDRHLSVVGGVRSIVHDYELEHGFQRSGYPEPDYEDLARARILHLFVDRGDDRDPEFGPIDWDRLLEPVGVG